MYKVTCLQEFFFGGNDDSKMGKLITFIVGNGGDLDQKKWNYDKGPL